MFRNFASKTHAITKNAVKQKKVFNNNKSINLKQKTKKQKNNHSKLTDEDIKNANKDIFLL